MDLFEGLGLAAAPNPAVAGALALATALSGHGREASDVVQGQMDWALGGASLVPGGTAVKPLILIVGAGEKAGLKALAHVARHSEREVRSWFFP